MPRPGKPLLKLCMIVKNEAQGIGRTLESVRGVVDAWLVLDTGSTDGTQDVVRELMAGIPGEVAEAPFVDFATSRNQAMALAGTDCEFLLCLDAEDVLRDGAALRTFLETARDDAYYMTVHIRDTALSSTRVSRASAAWRYRGAIHEVLMGPNGEIPDGVVPGATIHQERSGESQARTTARWERDLQLLLGEVTQDPANARAAFYLAQTLFCLGRLPEAIAAYRRRIALGGWIEEVYAAMEMVARLSKQVGEPWPVVQQLYLDAHAVAPHRAEPLCAIARHYVDAGQFAVGFLFAQRAYQLPFPTQDRLFVDAEVYAWRAADLLATTAYYVDELDLGERALAQAMAALPGDVGLLNTQRFYAQKRAAAAP